VRHCLEKNPEERFQSARDAAFGIEALSSISSTGVQAMAAKPRTYRYVWKGLAAILVLVALGLGFLLGSRGRHTAPQYERLTFKRGNVRGARFMGERRKLISDQIDHGSASFFPDGKRIVFYGAEPGRKPRTYVQDLDGGNPTPITSEGIAGWLLSPDGTSVIVGDGHIKIRTLDSRPSDARHSGTYTGGWSRVAVVGGQSIDLRDSLLGISRESAQLGSTETRAGLRNACAKGRRLDRPCTVVDRSRVAALRATGASWRAISRKLGVGIATLYRQEGA
jgi:hypothetical protein